MTQDEERHALRAAWPKAFDDGKHRAVNGDPDYPSGFGKWPPEKRNAWFAGFNIGFTKRTRP